MSGNEKSGNFAKEKLGDFKKMDSKGEIIERVFAAGLGIPHRKFAEWRRENLKKGLEWRYEREVILTQAGKAKSEMHFQVGKGEAVQANGIETGVVGRFNFRNPRLVLLDDGKTTIRVRDNKNYRPGMAIRYRNEGGSLVLVGRAPRWPGRY